MKQWVSLVLLACCSAAAAATDDSAALDLKPSEPASTTSPSTYRASVELAAGRLARRYDLADQDSRRASLDLSWTPKLSSSWRLGVSTRLDDIHPVDSGRRSTLFSLREAFAGWQDTSGAWGVDVGRVNLKFGPAYGFNPTDHFREGSSRAVTTADPLSLRDTRMGTFMVRVQRLWDGGSAGLTFAPKLRSSASDESLSADWGATNHSDRLVLTLGGRFGESVSYQLVALHDKGRGSQIGGSGTALLGESIVSFVEWSGGRDAELLSAAFDGKPRVKSSHRAAVGATYAGPSKVSLTFEFEYNGFGLSRAQWDQAVDRFGLESMAAYLFEVQRRQDIASRRAMLLYMSWRDAGTRNMDLTGLVRYNQEDQSRFYWIEARYRLPRFDIALQWQTNRGQARSEFGAQVQSSLVQLLAVSYF